MANYVLVRHPLDTSYFEENNIGYPSFESEDNGARFVTVDDYIKVFCEDPGPADMYKPVCWPESQELMEDPDYESYTEPIQGEKGFRDFGYIAFWVPLCYFITQ